MADPFLLPQSFPAPPRKLLNADESDIRVSRMCFYGGCTVWLAIAAYLIVIVLWAKLGVNTMGEVVNATRSRGGHSYLIRYAYDTPDGPQKGEEMVDVMGYLSLQPHNGMGGSTATVRFLKIGPFRYAGLVDFNDGGARAGAPILMMLFLGGMLVSIYFGGWILPARERRLVQTGLPILGKVISKRTEKGKKATQFYYVTCTYEDASHTKHEIETKITEVKRWESLAIGSAVTVLLHPARPKRALVYDFCRYRVEAPLPFPF